MANSELLMKFRTVAAFALFVVMYPALISIAILTKILGLLFGQKTAKNISGEIAVVTGAAHGLGRAIALELASKGCHVAVADVNLEQAKSTAEHIREKFNVKSEAYQVDVRDEDQVMELARLVSNDMGPTTILVNNAGVMIISNPVDPDPREVQRMIDVNLTAHFWTQRAFLPGMKQRKRGHVVAISSASSYIPLIYSAVYTSTKFGVRGLMRVLRQELAAEGFRDIHTTTVYPMFLQTNEDVVDLAHQIGFNQAYPMISGEEAATTIVAGMQRNEAEIVLPAFLAIFYRLIETFPSSWQLWLLLGPLIPQVRKMRRMLYK